MGAILGVGIEKTELVEVPDLLSKSLAALNGAYSSMKYKVYFMMNSRLFHERAAAQVFSDGRIEVRSIHLKALQLGLCL